MIEMSGERVFERVVIEEGQVVLPFYLLCDVSHSMQGMMAELNVAIERLYRAIVERPTLDDIAQICLITFSDNAKIRLPMGRMSESELPQLTAESGTNYSSAFLLLARSIQEDIAAFKRQGYRVFRPCVFFLTDGEPSDPDWQKTFTETLTSAALASSGLNAYPIFVPFGFGDANPTVLRRLAYPAGRGRWYYAKDAPVESVLSGMFQVISSTVISAGHAAASGRPEVVLRPPEPGSSVVQGDADEDAEDFI